MKIPVRIRLAIASCAVFLVVIAALEVTAWFSVRAAIHAIVDHELETRLAGLDDHLARHIQRIPWPELRASLTEHPAFQPELLRIETASGTSMFDGAGLRGLRLPAALPAPAVTTVGGASRSLRILTVLRRIQAQDYRLTLATDLNFPARILGRLWLLMLLSLPVVLLIAGGAGYWLSGRALRPVSDLIAAARAVAPSRLGERIPVPATHDEIQLLAETMNAMLTRIEAGFQQVRQFTANASHELRTPLAIIRTNAEVALLDDRDPSGKAARQALDRILHEAERGSSLLENMLLLARAEAAPPVSGPLHRTVDLRRSIAAACRDISPLAGAKQIHVEVAAAPDPCLASADEENLRRLWFILLDNAVKYTPSGGRVTARAGVNGSGEAFVTVSDTGIGIAAEHTARIFDRFYRVDQARSRDQGGAGLGLAIARHIAELHRASIKVTSESGIGSCFTVTFPQPQSADSAVAPAEQKLDLILR